MNNTKHLSLVAALALLAVVAMAIGLAVTVSLPEAAQAADVPLTVIDVNTAVLSSSTNFVGRIWADGYDHPTNADIYWSIDQGATPNTMTLKLQTSPDNSMWADYVTLATDNTADVSGAYTTTDILGKYFRVTTTNGNTEDVTPTIKVVLR